MRTARYFHPPTLLSLLAAGCLLLLLPFPGWTASPETEKKLPSGKTRPGEETSPPTGEVERLLDVLEMGGPPERRIALLALAQRGDFSAVPTLSALLRDEDTVVRRLSEQALWSIWSRSGDQVADALLKRGVDFLGGRRFAKALHIFDDVIAMQPEFAEGYNKRATAFYYLGRYKQSLADIDRTLKRNPYHFGALSGAGLCMLGLERFDEALLYFRRALKVNPNLGNIAEMVQMLEKKLNKPLI